MITTLAVIGCVIVAFVFVDTYIAKGRFIGTWLVLDVLFLLASAAYGVWWITQHYCQ